MQKLGIYTLDQPGGRITGDLTYQAQNVTLRTNERGFESLVCSLPLPLTDSFRFFEKPIDHIVAKSDLLTAFEGRTEDRSIVDNGVELTAFGYQRGASDIPYTALWSDKHYARWRQVTNDELANRKPERYEMDNNNRVYIAPRKGESFPASGNAGSMTYAAPHLGDRSIVAFSCSYSMLLPANWRFRVATWDYGFSSSANINDLNATGSLQSGTLNLTFTGADRLEIQVSNNTGAISTITADTGTNFLKLTNVRVKTNTASTITADLIIADLISFIYGENPTQINPAQSALSLAVGDIDLIDALYEDLYPADILNELMEQSTANARMQWGIWEDRILQFHERGAIGRTWYTDITKLNLNRTADTLANSVYGTYTNGRGETERTAVSEDLQSIERIGITRRAYTNAPSATQATQTRDLLLAERAEITPKASVELNGLFNAQGARFPLWRCRAGDVIVIRNLPINYSPSIDKIRKFYVSSTTYDLKSDRLRPSPELDLPGLDIIMGNTARRSPGIDLSYNGRNNNYR